MAENTGNLTLPISIPNTITITLMVLGVFAVVGFALRAFRQVVASRTGMSPVSGTTDAPAPNSIGQ